jgi:hypothetical protein
MKEPEKKRQPREAYNAKERKLDEELEESFPASDPPANTTPTSSGGPQRAPPKPSSGGKTAHRK